jgi:cysteine desulfurase|uniref:cysteine desulfurase n=1 Tax=Desulfobacca acetoxidans TaxID=60893 RepID=A0A7V6A648_9BACT
MIYLDYNATTPIAPEVVKAMSGFLGEEFGNPASGYPHGWRAAEAVAAARKEVAETLSCTPEEIVFTSGATEGSNTVIKGVAWHFRAGQIITTAVEHPAVSVPCQWLAAQGFEITTLPVDSDGLVDPEEVRQALTPRSILVSVMHANNETGAIQPVAEIGAITREAGVLLHTDAAQSVGKIPVNVEELQVDFLTMAGHKCYAPKGVGALFVRRGAKFEPLLHGGGQEGGRRSGTENVPYIVALGEACRLAREGLAANQARFQELRDRLHTLLEAGYPNLVLNGPPTARLPNTLNVSFPGLSGRAILSGIWDLEASVGAACHGDEECSSPVLTAMGVSPEVALGAVRLSVGRPTTLAEVEEAARLLLAKVQELEAHR